MRSHCNRCLQVGVLASLTLLLGSCRVSSGQSQIKDVIPFSAGNAEPKLGDAYDSLVQELRNVPSCVSGTTAKLTSSGVSIDLNQNIDGNQLMREFSGEVNGTPRLAFIQVGAAGGYFNSLSRKSSALNLVYAVKIQNGGERLVDVSLGAANKTLTPTALFQGCGDAFVAQINRGGLLSITLTLDFGSDENRAKWQAKLKLSGALGDIAHDLGNKVEHEAMDGVLTIKVNQLGGTPSQSLVSVKSCALNSAEDYAACKQRMDDLMAYASGAFPQQVDANPAVLNYVTASLQTLGAQNMPRLGADILSARQQLAQLNQDSTYYGSMLKQAQDIGLPMEPELVAAINANGEAIKQAVTACFTYQYATDGLDWSACQAQFKGLGATLKGINRDAVTINELNIPADSEVGNSIVNGFDSKMAVLFVAGKGKTWFYDQAHVVGTDGMSVDGHGAANANAISPRDKQGALLMRTDQSYQPINDPGRLDLYPGEAVGFVMNDVMGSYGDNHGSQVIYWRCANCGPSLKKMPTYRLRVKANSATGAAFYSHENLTGTYRVVAYGLWRTSRAGQATDAGGGTRSCGGGCLDPQSPAQTLVMRQGSNGPVVAVGRDKTLGITANTPVYFVMNNSANNYSSNQGELELILQCKRCDIKSHPIILEDDPNTP